MFVVVDHRGNIGVLDCLEDEELELYDDGYTTVFNVEDMAILDNNYEWKPVPIYRSFKDFINSNTGKKNKSR